MELFDLVAKLTLNAREYESAISDAERKGGKIQDIEANLDLDTSAFDSAIQDAENEDVDDPESPELGLDTSDFDLAVKNAEETEVDDPSEPDLDLDKSDFDDTVSDAEDAVINDPDEPSLGLDKTDFDSTVSDAEGTEVNDPASPSLDLDASDFDEAIESAESAEVSDPDSPELDLDTSAFDDAVERSESVEIADPDSPSLDLDTSSYETALDESQSATQIWHDVVGGIFDGLKDVFVASGIAAAVSGVVSSLSEAVDLAAKLGDDVDKSSRRLNISTVAYQEWSHALSQSGASINDFSRGILSMNKYLSGADVTEDVTDAFTKLGVGAKVANGQIKTTEDLLTETVKALADFSGSKEERGALATAIFGRGGNTLNALFDSGSAGIETLLQEAHELGLVMSDEEIANNVAYGDALANVQAAVTALKTSVVSDLMPELTKVMNTVAAIVAFFNPRTKQQSLSDIYADADENFAEQLVDIEATGEAAETLVDKLLSMGDTSKMTAEQYAIWKGTADELIKLVPTLSGVIDTETGKINANSAEIKENIKQWENLARQKALQTLKEEKYQAIVGKNKDLITASIDANRKAANAEKARVEAYHKFSDEMERQGLGKLDFEAGDLDEQIKSVFDKLAEMGDAGEPAALALGTTLKELGEAKTEADKAQANVKRITAEIEKGKKEYEEWLAAAEALYGTFDISAEKADTFEDAIDFEDITTNIQELKAEIDSIPLERTIYFNVEAHLEGLSSLPSWANPDHEAKGQWNVPYDDFPALLHRNEMVLSASQARQYREDDGSNVNVNALASVVASAVREGMAGAVVRTYLNGKDVTDDVARRIGDAMKSQRYAT